MRLARFKVASDFLGLSPKEETLNTEDQLIFALFLCIFSIYLHVRVDRELEIQ